jgi:glucosamine--fructose-6-phosphate aminotransferase (isomerizing)
VHAPVKTVQAHSGAAELGPYRHYMQKEIFEQPRAIGDTLQGVESIMPELFGDGAHKVFKEDRLGADPGLRHQLLQRLHRQVLAGSIAKIPTQVEIASEYRYRESVPNPKHAGGHHQPVRRNGRHARGAEARALAGHGAHADGLQRVDSAMVRECKLAYITRAGVEIGVASTKAFTTQLAGLFLLTLTLAQVRGRLTETQEAST